MKRLTQVALPSDLIQAIGDLHKRVPWLSPNRVTEAIVRAGLREIGNDPDKVGDALGLPRIVRVELRRADQRHDGGDHAPRRVSARQGEG